MRTITKNVYSFSELSEQAKIKAIEDHANFIGYENWWEDIYEDAENVRLKITSFDLDRGKIDGCFKTTAMLTADLILENHGKDTKTYKEALKFCNNWDSLVEKYSDGINLNKVDEVNADDFDEEADEMEKEFLKSLLYEYLFLLRNDYEYQTSESVIIENIEANGYEFYENGELI